MEMQLPFTILPQPTETTCGPTCLHSVYRYYEDSVSLNQIVSEIQTERHGTLAVFLANHALRRGYRATIFSYNLQLFDPTWFSEIPVVNVSEKLKIQAGNKSDPKLHIATHGYLEFLKLGGILRFEDLSQTLLQMYLKKKIPIITGLSATYLYHSAREAEDEFCNFDDVRGYCCGHFVVLHGFDAENGTISVADPLRPNPISINSNYQVRIERIICAILLGVLTYDGNLLIIEKPVSDHA